MKAPNPETALVQDTAAADPGQQPYDSTNDGTWLWSLKASGGESASQPG